MFRQSRSDKVKETAVNASELALLLAQDKRFRKRLLSAIQHGSEVGRRARRETGVMASVRRLAADQSLRAELRGARDDLQQAYGRVEQKRRTRYRLRTLVLGVGLASLAVPQIRARVAALVNGSGSGESTVPPRRLDDLTKEELYRRAQDAEISGRADMSKDELIAALRAKS